MLEADKAEALLVGSGRWLLLHDGDNDDDNTETKRIKRQRMQSFREEARRLVDIRTELHTQLDELTLQQDIQQRLRTWLSV